MRVLSHPLTAWLFLALSLLLTLLAWQVSNRFIRERVADRFTYRTEEVQLAIRDRMASYVAILRGGTGLFVPSQEVTRQDWATYVGSLGLHEQFPGIQGMGFSQVVAAADLPDHVRRIREEGFPQYTPWPAGERPLHTAIIYLEPFDWRNRRAFGYDMLTEPTRRQAMEQARDTGQPVTSGRVVLVQETDQDPQLGFLVYIPVYRRGQPVASLEERQRSLQGFVYAPFRIRDLMQGILGQRTPDIHFHIYDGPDIDAARILCDGIPEGHSLRSPPSELERIVRFPLPGGHPWTMVFHSSPALMTTSEASQPLLVAFGGLIIDLLLFVVIADISRREGRAQERAVQMTRTIQEHSTALRRSEERLSTALEGVGDGVWDWDVPSGTVFFSVQWKAMLGHAPQEVGSGLEEWSSRVHPEDLPRTMADVQAHLEGRTAVYSNEHRVRHKDGRYLWILDRGRVIIRDAAGKAVRVVGTHTDVTARHDALDALHRSEHQFRLLIASAPVGIAVIDGDTGDCLQANPAVERIVGLPPERLLGMNIRRLESWQRSGLLAEAEATLHDGRTRHCEALVPMTSGRRSWLTHDFLRLDDPTGPRLLVILDDITSRKSTEEERARLLALLEDRVAERTAELRQANDALSQRDQRLRIFAAVIEQAQSAIIISDHRMRITYVNPAWQALAARPGDDLEPGGNHLDAIFLPDHQDTVVQARQVLGAGATWAGMLRRQAAGHQALWLDTLITPITGMDGCIIGHVSEHRDVTGIRQAEAEARQRTEELIQADKMAALGTLVAGVGHEINNPAHFISLNAPLLKGYWADALPALEAHALADPSFRLGRLPWPRAKALIPRLFQGIEDGVMRIRRIVGDLRTFTQPDPGGDQPQDLNHIVQAATAITRHVINRSTGGFTCHLQEGLPQITGSFQKLEQVVVNLLLNACQALPSRDRAVSVTTATDAQRHQVVLTIADAGVGIPPDQLSRLGEPFFTTKRSHGGTGLGLSITRRIVQDHGGEIHFSSIVAVGTTVTVRLPAGRQAIGPGPADDGAIPCPPVSTPP